MRSRSTDSKPMIAKAGVKRRFTRAFDVGGWPAQRPFSARLIRPNPSCSGKVLIDELMKLAGLSQISRASTGPVNVILPTR
jgi:hypothetical protein